MATQVKHRRGNTSEIENFTPAVAEIVVNTDDSSLNVGDGVRKGGKKILTELQTIARSLNCLESQVIYSTDTSTILDGVFYIYDRPALRVWAKPDVGPGETITDVSGDQLTTTGDTYTMKIVQTVNGLSIRDAIAAHVAAGGLSFVILGDSTECGVGGTGGPYGETTTEIRNGAGNRVGFSMVCADPNFVGIDPQYPDYRTISSDVLSVEAAYPCAGLIVTRNPKYETQVLSQGRNSRDKLTVYYHQRTADTAARAVITVYDLNDVQIAQQTLDSYTGPITYGSVGTFDVGGRLAKFTIDLGTSLRGVRVVVDQLDVIDRGNGLAGNGTLLIHGFTLGEGVSVHNLAVSSTTLTEGSADNVTRGVDTSERVALAKSLGADVVYIGWGTNDSKDGVTTVDQFKADYRALIDNLRTWKPEIKIIMATDPLGLGSPYENNPTYHNAVREIAAEKGIVLFDVEKIFNISPGSYYADNVHPSPEGYQALHYALCDFTGVVPFEYQEQRYDANRYGVRSHTFTLPVTNDTSGNFISVLNESVPLPSWARGYIVSATINVGLSGQDLDQCAGRLEINGSTVAQQVVNAGQLSGVSLDQIVLTSAGDFLSQYQDVQIELFLRDYGIRSADSSSKVHITFI